MGIYDNIKIACKQNNLSINKLEKELGFARSSISKFNTNTPSIDKVVMVANRLNVSVDFLMSGKNNDTDTKQELTKREENDISKILQSTKEQLMNQEGLMFDGVPATQEAIDSIISAMQIGMEMARIKNKEKYTPKKYKKDDVHEHQKKNK